MKTPPPLSKRRRHVMREKLRSGERDALATTPHSATDHAKTSQHHTPGCRLWNRRGAEGQRAGEGATAGGGRADHLDRVGRTDQDRDIVDRQELTAAVRRYRVGNPIDQQIGDRELVFQTGEARRDRAAAGPVLRDDELELVVKADRAREAITEIGGDRGRKRVSAREVKIVAVARMVGVEYRRIRSRRPNQRYCPGQRN